MAAIESERISLSKPSNIYGLRCLIDSKKRLCEVEEGFASVVNCSAFKMTFAVKDVVIL